MPFILMSGFRLGKGEYMDVTVDKQLYEEIQKLMQKAHGSLTVRQEYKKAAMQGLSGDHDLTVKDTVAIAVQLANAMIAEDKEHEDK